MANPNIVNVTNILGNTSSFLITGTANPFATALVNNPSSSGKVYKINSIMVANVDGASAADITVRLYSQENLGGTGTEIVSTVTVPAKATLIVVDKSTSIYLLENKSIGVTASASNDLVVTASWDEIS
jgi:hypothetical protein